MNKIMSYEDAKNTAKNIEPLAMQLYKQSEEAFFNLCGSKLYEDVINELCNYYNEMRRLYKHSLCIGNAEVKRLSLVCDIALHIIEKINTLPCYLKKVA